MRLRVATKYTSVALTSGVIRYTTHRRETSEWQYGVQDTPLATFPRSPYTVDHVRRQSLSDRVIFSAVDESKPLCALAPVVIRGPEQAYVIA